MPKFREIPRGWTSDFGEVTVERLSVDPVFNNWDVLHPSGSDFIEADIGEPLMTSESNPDYWIERLVVHYEPFAIPTALNAAGFCDLAVGLFIANDAVSFHEQDDVGLQSVPFFADNFRSVSGVRRILRVAWHRATQRELDRDENDVIEWAPAQPFHTFDVKNIFLQKDEAVNIVVACARGSEQLGLTWTVGDVAGVTYVTQALVRKKKGR